jgi:[glutamine synthetase] adenylyltransferase / [glutamine synthetase]-adenylyl-L-tyrosine phosphorylase
VLGVELKPQIKALCPEISDKVLDDFFVRMDEDYFTTFSPEDIATHIRMSAGLDSKHRIDVRVTPRRSGSGEFDIIIVGFDYLSAFSIFCGLLSSFGLDIRAGNIYSFARSQASRATPRKIVDVFRVGLKEGEVFDEPKQREFEQELQTLAELLATGSTDQARERLNRFLTERIERMNEPLSGLVYPIQIRFDNALAPEWTVMEAQSKDTFALLYAISNALAMQGIYIHKVKIRSVDDEARDHFFISDRWSRKIEDPAQQERLRTAVAMIKQFTRFLPEAPDPGLAMRHFDQFLDKMADEKFQDDVMSFLERPQGMNLLAHLLGSSDYLWHDFLGVHLKDSLPFLKRLADDGSDGRPLPDFQSLQSDLRQRLDQAKTLEEQKGALNRFKDEQVFSIDVQHLLNPGADPVDFSRALTRLAEVVLAAAIEMCTADSPLPGAFAVCGLGKFGGAEMGYASDLELMFVHEEPEGARTFSFESLARQVIECIETRRNGTFQVDLRLRPYGDAGAWSTPLDEFKRYYSPGGAAAPFERQALIKLRWVAGDEALGRRVEAHRDSFTYGGAAWDAENALHLRRRQMRELVKGGEINVKYSAGGIIDIEYAVQYLQLLHGKDHVELRVPNTLDALDALRRLQIVSPAEYDVLRPGYVFLRNLIDALRVVRDEASDLILPQQASEEFKALARRLGYREFDRTRAAERLAADIRQHLKTVHAVFVARFEKAS